MELNLCQQQLDFNFNLTFGIQCMKSRSSAWNSADGIQCLEFSRCNSVPGIQWVEAAGACGAAPAAPHACMQAPCPILANILLLTASKDYPRFLFFFCPHQSLQLKVHLHNATHHVHQNATHSSQAPSKRQPSCIQGSLAT